MKNFFHSIGLAMLAGLFGAMAAHAAEQKLSAQEAMEYSKKAEIANYVISIGTENKDSLLLLSGVKLLDEIPAGVVKLGQTGKGAATYDRDALLDQAKIFAGKNKNLLEVIADVKAEKKRGYYVPTCVYEWFCNAYGYCWWKYICY